MTLGDTRMDNENLLQDQLDFLYGNQSEEISNKIIELIDEFRARNPGTHPGPFQLSEKDTILITYGDQFQSPNQGHLRSLADFLNQYIGDAITWVHLLPFYPYSSDDGFSVIDHRQVDPKLGSWADILKLSEKYRLMFDAVINHISKESGWFKAFQRGEIPYNKYFIEIDPGIDLSSIFRPRTLPLIHPVDTSSGEKYVWTTFSEDQIDLDFSNPEVLLEIIDLLLFYVENGASLIRLDAVGYIWKDVSTSSLNLPQAHSVVKILRAVLNLAAPHAGTITETNVPHEENIKYFGEPASTQLIHKKNQSGDEAQMVYQFSLAPLILHTFQTQDATVLTNWIRTLSTPYLDSAFFNFIASHDGIGVMPAKGLLTSQQIQILVEKTLAHGGEVSYKTNADGSESVYELNITLYDALNDPADNNVEVGIKRFLASQAIMLSLAGVPGIYVHSLFGSRNCHAFKEKTGRARSLNREKYNLDDMQKKMDDPGSVQYRVLNQYRHLLEIRKKQSAFHPVANQSIVGDNKRVFTLLRTNEEQQSTMLCLVNISEHKQQIDLDLNPLGIDHPGTVHDLVSGEFVTINNGHLQQILDAYQVQWIPLN